VAEFSRGKSELINAIFFADAGRRVLPATPGRTTMCPVELGHDAERPASLSLLPIRTRLEGLSLAELRDREPAWQRQALDPHDPQRLAEVLQEVTRVEVVSIGEARSLGFWNDAAPQDNPRVLADGRVEVPAWRHAVINFPHPLLKRGLVVLDTPGLNAIGAEPELTLGLLPSAHATVFVLAADTGVTRSDIEIWREHLGGAGLGSTEGSRFVVLNKIDTLIDPLSSREAVQRHIDHQVAQTAEILGVPPQQVFALSAREALAARVAHDAAALEASRLPVLEQALATQLLPRRHQWLSESAAESLAALKFQFGRQLTDRRRQLTEQLLELRGLRGKSGAKVQAMLERVDREAAEFESCTAQLQALRSVHSRVVGETLAIYGLDALREEMVRMQQEARAGVLGLGARKAFVALCERLRGRLLQGRRQAGELRELLHAGFQRLNSEFGFSLALEPGPALDRFAQDLDLIERNYVRYLGLSQALKLSNPVFVEQFRRMLLSKLRVVFEQAAAEIEDWNRKITAQVEQQLRERRRGFKRRREALERIRSASSDLESRLVELQAQESRLVGCDARLQALLEQLGDKIRAMPVPPVLTQTSHGDEGADTGHDGFATTVLASDGHSALAAEAGGFEPTALMADG
jgi:hypothetical protein